MQNREMELLQNMFPQFLHIVERKCTPSWEIDESIIDCHNIILIYRGKASFKCNENEFNGTPGSLVYFKPGDLRRANTFHNNLMNCFAVDFNYTCPVFSKNGWELYSPELLLQPIQNIQDTFLFDNLLELFSQLTSVWISGRKDKTVRCRSIFSEIIGLLLLVQNNNSIEFSKYRKVEKVISYMTVNYASRLSLKDLAEYAQISPSYLGSIFRQITGKSPIEYLIGIRIMKAKELLKDGCTVSQTAQMLGFSDVFYFSKCFKKYEGVPPSLSKS